MELFLFWIVMAVICAMVATNKGHSGIAWFIYGFIIWPIALVHAILIAPPVNVELEKAVQRGMRKCPACAEMIKAEAKLCRFCRTELEQKVDMKPAEYKDLL